MYYTEILKKEKEHNLLEIREDNGVRIFHHHFFDEFSPCIFISCGADPVSPEEHKAIRSRKKDISRFYHAHDSFFLVYVLEGETLEFIEGQPFDVTENDLLLITPYTRHHNIFTADSKILFIHIDSEKFLQSLQPAVMENIFFSDFFCDFLSDSHTRKALLFKDCIPHVNWILELILKEYLSEDLLFNSCIQYLLGTLVIELARSQSYQAQNFSECASPHMKEILLYITKNFRDTSLTQVASHFGYNSAYLSRRIRQSTGKNFGQLITDYKLNLAVIMIRQQNLSIEKIAYSCGYQDISTFYKAFRKKFHCTPKELLIRTES